MAAMEMTLDLPTIFDSETFDSGSYEALKKLAFSGKESLNRFRELISEMEKKAAIGQTDVPRAALKLGMCYLLFGQDEKAAQWLEKAIEGPEKHYYLALALREQRHYQDSIEQFKKAGDTGWDELHCVCQCAENLIRLDDLSGAKDILDQNASTGEQASTWHFIQGRYLAAIGEIDRAVEAFGRALDRDPDYVEALFHLAYLLRLHGSDQRSIELYDRLLEISHVHINALINLSVIYEDELEYDQAEKCLRRVLAVDPNHPRAKLYLKDVIAAKDMFIDEEQIIDDEKHNAVLDIPVSDFELSVRSRNCLKKMDIHNLGDLLRTTEAELLAYKNFGETSLKEIKVMLKQKGLSLSQVSQEPAPDTNQPPDAQTVAPVEPQARSELLALSVSTLDLSVRSRKCLQVLGLTTIEELISRSEHELLSSRNFGITSLNEIKECLMRFGLTLKGASQNPSDTMINPVQFDSAYASGPVTQPDPPLGESHFHPPSEA